MRHSVVLLILLSLMTACTEKGDPVNRHESDRRVSPEQTTTQVEGDSIPSNVSGNIDELGSRVLDPARIRDPRSLTQRIILDELLTLNNLLIRSKPAARESAAFTKILKAYVTGLQLECGEIKSSCVGLAYFRMASNSSEVAKMAALRPEFAAQSSRLLLFALEMKNRNPDNELLRLVLSKVPPENQALRSMLDSTLLLSAQNLKDEAKTREFLTAIKAWELVDNQKWMLSSGAQSALWSMIARGRFIYGADGKTHPEFQAFAQRLNNRPDSLAKQQAKMLERRSFKPEALGAKVIGKLDEVYFLIDAIFLQAISGQNAAELLLSMQRSPEDLSKAIENFVRMRFALALYDSTLLAEDVFNAPVPANQLLHHSLRQSALVKQVWGNLETRLSMVKGFATTVLKQTPGGDKFEPGLRGLFNSYGRSVNLASVYPHTMLLFHHLSQKRFSIYLRGLGDVDTGDLMTLLFHGAIPPILGYSDETAALNHFEVLHAFDLAVRSQLFPSVKIDVDHFMSDTLSRLNQNPVNYIENKLNTVEQRFGESKLFREFRNVCREFRTGVKIPRVLTLEGLRRSPLYGDTMEMLYTAVNSKGSTSSGERGSISENEMGLFYADHEYSEALEQARLNLQMYERLGHSMMVSYTDYLRRFEKMSEQEINLRTAKTRAILDNMRKLRERTLNTARTWYKEIGDCYFKVAKTDYDSYHEVLRDEEQYLARVHRDIKRLRMPGISEAEKQQIVQSHQFRGLPSNFKGQSKLDQNGYLFAGIDFVLRTAQTIQKKHPQISVNLGSKLDLDVDIVRGTPYTPLPFVESEEEFIKSGIKAIFKSGTGGPAVFWMALAGGRIIAWEDYLKTLITSYRLEEGMEGSAKVFTPERIMQAHEELVRLTAFTAEDQRLFETLRLRQRFDILYLSDVLVSYAADIDLSKWVLQDILAMFDMPIMLIGLEKLGFDYDLTHMGPEKVPEHRMPKRFGHMQLGRHYYKARSSWIRGTPVIPYNTVLDRFLDHNVTSYVQGDLKATKKFHQAALAYIDEINKRPAALRPYADIDMDTRITEMLSDNLIPSYEADVQQFRQQTQGCFVLKCADFK